MMKALKLYSLIAILFSYLQFSSKNTARANLQGEVNSNSRMPSCRNGEMLLSNNRTLAPLELVQASQSLSIASATRVYDSVMTWCTTDNDPNPYIDMQFTSPVLISMMISTGSTFINPNNQLGIYYVTNFSLEYSPPDNSSVLNYYTSTDEPAVPEYFSVTDFTTLIQFKRPFLTQRIRLRPVDWFDSDGNAFRVQYLCQGVDLYGCLQLEAMELRSTAAVQVVKDNQPLFIALPITLITIAVLLVLLGVLVYLLIRRPRATRDINNPDSGYSYLERSQQSVTSLIDEHSVTLSDEEARYHQQRQPSITKIVDNPIYGERSVSLDGKPRTLSSVSEPGYEPVGSSELQTAEEQPRLLVDGNEMTRRGLNPIPEVSEENETVMINTSYEPIELGEHSDISKGTHVEESKPRADSMIDNTAYTRESHGGGERTRNDGEEGGDYEAVVMLQNNSSYNYVTPMPLPSPAE